MFVNENRLLFNPTCSRCLLGTSCQNSTHNVLKFYFFSECLFSLLFQGLWVQQSRLKPIQISSNAKRIRKNPTTYLSVVIFSATFSNQCVIISAKELSLRLTATVPTHSAGKDLASDCYCEYTHRSPSHNVSKGHLGLQSFTFAEKNMPLHLLETQ